MSTMSEDVNPTDGTVDRGVPSEGEESAVACRSREMRHSSFTLRTPASASQPVSQSGSSQLQGTALQRRTQPSTRLAPPRL